MLRKTVTLGSIIAALGTTSTLAHSGMFNSGFLAGAHVGAAFGSGSFNATDNPNTPNGSSSLSGRGKKTAAILGVLGGYRQIFNQDMTIGAELAIDFLTSNEIKKRLVHFGTAPADNKLTRQYSFIPSINIGKIFCGRYHAYLGLGLAISRFKLQAFNPLDNITLSGTQTRLGFVPSLNLEYAATQSVSVVGSVGYEIYQKVKKTFNATQFSGNPGATYSSSISPRYLTVKIGAIYKF